jgi:MinD superfamily P-loop ATPase
MSGKVQIKPGALSVLGTGHIVPYGKKIKLMEHKYNMIKLAIASGKGGTGKTTVAVNLALALEDKNVQYLDCDVEEPNAHLFLKPVIENSREIGIPVPKINFGRCNFCGRCAEVCAFNALAVFQDKVMVFEELCHGCGSCAYLCPEKAITEVERPIGLLEEGTAGGIKFAHGRLNPGEVMSPPLIEAVKKVSRPGYINIIDAPPGTSCPVVSAVGGCNYCLLVTEPTPFGLNDLDLAYQMVTRLGIPSGVLINRSDLGDDGVEKYCREKGLAILQRIPWDRELASLYARGEPVVKHLDKWRVRFRELFDKISTALKEASSH